MGTNAAIDAAIGLIMMYLVLSLIATVVNEFISTAFGMRAKTLKTGLEQLLDDPVLKAHFYDHGMISAANSAVGNGHVSYLSGRTFAMAVVGSLDPTKPIPGISDLKSALQHMPDSNIRDVLLSQLSAANGDLDQFRQNVAAYFDHAMDRISGIYKRYLKIISLAVGVAIAGALNADSIGVGQALWKDSSIRAEMVQTAASFVNAGAATQSTPGSVSQVADKISEAESTLRPLPVGWTAPQPHGVGWLFKFAGWILTALAISLGAPFWFDLLSKFMNLRGTGPKPEKSDTA